MGGEGAHEIRGLSAALVAPDRFPSRRWYRASPLWYYHGPRRGGDRRPLRRDVLSAGVDPELGVLCARLLDAGLATTPSCQGHFYPEAWFRVLWHDLRRDASASDGDVVFAIRVDSASLGERTAAWRAMTSLLGGALTA